jgi:excisionase family DNA binding protein
MPEALYMPAMLTCGEVAEALNVETSTVYRWAREGVVPSVRIGGTVRIPPVALEALLRDASADTTPEEEA